MKGMCQIEPLFHATIEGRKWMTRRVIKSQPLHDIIEVYGMFFDGVAYSGWEIIPRYKIGDIVYLKEPYLKGSSGDVIYKYPIKSDVIKRHFEGKWKNKLFMPESAARYFIKITAVRAERLQDISEGDCFKEGIIPIKDPIGMSDGYHWIPGSNFLYATPREAYAALIDKINGKGGISIWEENPFVFVYNYLLCDKYGNVEDY